VTISKFFENVLKFKYLGSKVTFVNGIRDYVECRKISAKLCIIKHIIFYFPFISRENLEPDEVALNGDDDKNFKTYLVS
jgi:hypothetical protein